MAKRYLPSRDFPSYIFVPGTNPHPKKSGGHMEGEEDPVAEAIDLELPQNNQYLSFALDLFNHKYFWESHVYFEALWNAHGRQGSVADFLKAMIKLGAAGVKQTIHQADNYREHLKRARELFDEVKVKEGNVFLGFDLGQIIQQIDKSIDHREEIFQVHPRWE